MCGSYTLGNFLLSQGGLVGKYHSNRYLLNEPILTQIDIQVNFNWGVSSLIPGITKEDQVSAEWNGFFKVDTTGSYTFSVHANDGVRVYIDQNLVVD
jgi:hypothetical protein